MTTTLPHAIADGGTPPARDRALTYRLFSTLLAKEASVEFLRAASLNPPIEQGELGDYFASLEAKGLEDARGEAASEFAALLLNMSANPVITYESVYTSDEGLMMQDARDAVVAQYRACGFALDKSTALPEDHVSFELEFMALLCEREAACEQALDAAELGRVRAREKRFLEDHILVWVPDFCHDLHAKARCGLYRGIAQALLQFLAFEREEFDR